MQLPKSNKLPINLLAACFNHTVATYKYYWLLSIVESINSGDSIISKKDLFSTMVSNAWYTVNYFHISFGKQDLIQDAIKALSKIENISIDEKKEKIFKKLSNSINSETNRTLLHFDKNVPHWFLSPWFPRQSEKIIYEKSKRFENDCLYALNKEYIEVNPYWKDYIIENSKILKNFCYWNLVLFLQAKNPNVPDIPNKIIKQPNRKSLNRQRIYFWDLFFSHTDNGYIKCIYSGKDLTIGDYAVEHFIPYSFVSHDLIWNLIPADKSFNSSKSDKLPPLEKYFNSFFTLQKAAIEIVKDKDPNNALLEDYLTIFPNLDNSISEEKFREVIQPLITIASNNGFEFLQ